MNYRELAADQKIHISMADMATPGSSSDYYRYDTSKFFGQVMSNDGVTVVVKNLNTGEVFSYTVVS